MTANLSIDLSPLPIRSQMQNTPSKPINLANDLLALVHWHRLHLRFFGFNFGSVSIARNGISVPREEAIPQDADWLPRSLGGTIRCRFAAVFMLLRLGF